MLELEPSPALEAFGAGSAGAAYAGAAAPTLADKNEFSHGLYSIGQELLGQVIIKLDQRCPEVIER